MDTFAVTLFNDVDDYLGVDLDEQLTQKAIFQALEKYEGELLFDPKDLVFENYASRCINENSFTSLVNYIEAKNVGYFFVISPLTDQINVIFCRWD